MKYSNRMDDKMKTSIHIEYNVKCFVEVSVSMDWFSKNQLVRTLCIHELFRLRHISTLLFRRNRFQTCIITKLFLKKEKIERLF